MLRRRGWRRNSRRNRRIPFPPALPPPAGSERQKLRWTSSSHPCGRERGTGRCCESHPQRVILVGKSGEARWAPAMASRIMMCLGGVWRRGSGAITQGICGAVEIVLAGCCVIRPKPCAVCIGILLKLICDASEVLAGKNRRAIRGTNRQREQFWGNSGMRITRMNANDFVIERAVGLTGARPALHLPQLTPPPPPPETGLKPRGTADG